LSVSTIALRRWCETGLAALRRQQQAASPRAWKTLGPSRRRGPDHTGAHDERTTTLIGLAEGDDVVRRVARAVRDEGSGRAANDRRGFGNLKVRLSRNPFGCRDQHDGELPGPVRVDAAALEAAGAGGKRLTTP